MAGAKCAYRKCNQHVLTTTFGTATWNLSEHDSTVADIPHLGGGGNLFRPIAKKVIRPKIGIDPRVGDALRASPPSGSIRYFSGV
jgi:hypothetical protein